MSYLEYLKSKGVDTYENYCNCGGYALDSEHPHLSWCAQYEEYESWYRKYEYAIEEGIKAADEGRVETLESAKEKWKNKGTM